MYKKEIVNTELQVKATKFVTPNTNISVTEHTKHVGENMKEIKEHLRGVSVWGWMSDLTSCLAQIQNRLYIKITVSSTSIHNPHITLHCMAEICFGTSN